MNDLQWMREHIDVFAAAMAKRGVTFDVAAWQALDQERRQRQTQLQADQALRNQRSKQIGQCKAKGEDAAALMAEVQAINERLQTQEQALETIAERLESLMMSLPNIPHASVPVGQHEDDNVELKRWGLCQQHDHDHVDIGQTLGMDFETGRLLSGSRFVALSGQLARLHRVLAQWMLDTHVDQHGYEEYALPYLVHEDMLRGTGQLPKMADDLFSLEDSALCLIPTGEVPLVNAIRGMKGLDASQLPKRWVTHTPCFRKEAGSYGKDTKGMIRMHQFDKVEMVQITRQEDAYEALEAMLAHAESLLQQLELPYRVVTLCTGDMGFTAAKTYDIEVWLPSQKRYREICSISNCEAFQARRMKVRYQNTQGEKQWVHTLNGTGLAVGRTLVALLENGWCADGRVRLPQVLAERMQGKTHLEPEALSKAAQVL